MTTETTAAEQSRILIVDDEIGPRESLRILLKPSYHVRTASSGRAALEEIPRFRPDLVILDIKMAEMDGLETLRRVKQLDPSIEVVMITAYASLETVKLALTHGAFEYLIKPFPRHDLEAVVRRALGRRQTDLGRQGQISKLVDEMRTLAAKTRELEEAARRESTEQSLRLTQHALLREISRTIVTQLDVEQLTTTITGQLRSALGYDSVAIAPSAPAPTPESAAVVVCPIRDAEGRLGFLVVDNRASGHAIDPRERELLEMIAEYLAIALRNSRLYGEIAETKRSLEQLIACAGEAIVSIDATDAIEGWNPAAERIFGLTERDAIGRPIRDLILGSDYDNAKHQLAEGLPMHAFETRTILPGGAGKTLTVTLSALHGRHGSLEGLIAVIRDVTLQREVENQLQQSEKLRALGQLAGGIAHDFNNLLQAILGYTQLMKQGMENAELVRRSLSIVESAAIDGSETVRRIQQFARLRPDEPFVRVDLAQIVRDAAAMTRPRWEERASRDNQPLEMRLDLAAVPPINGRPAALTETMTNLILNALDAMLHGGTLSIATRVENEQVIVAVRDTGCGMTDDVRRRIFEPFFSTKGDAGSGLGLAMAYAIVKRHSGDIRVESAAGEGATFTLTFPVAVDFGVPRSEPPRSTGHRSARILLIDDDEQVLGTLAEMLESVGHQVTAFSTGADAVRAYGPGRFELVLTNVGMAGMNGWEVAKHIRAKDRAVTIVFITGWGLRDQDQVRLDALDIRRCIFKPVGPATLDAEIQAALASR